MRNSGSIFAAAMMFIAAPAFAQGAPAAGAATAPAGGATATAAAPAAGQTVYDTAGGEVGKIDKIDGSVAVIATGKNSVGLPLTSFAMGDKGPVIAMTRDQLDAAASSAAASAAAKIAAGAAVSDTAGGAVGTIKSIEGEFALLDTSAVQVKLPLSAFAVNGDKVVIGMTKTQVEAAAAASKPAAK
jgi:preprotein translocase subunit YajC